MGMHSVAHTTVPSEVPGRSHYGREYIAGGRLFSYAHQIHDVLSFNPRRVVEIGPGPGVTRAILQLADVEVVTVDLQPELDPDVIGSVLDIPLDDDACDVAMCCQVLEHLPFNKFTQALQELRRISRAGVVLSLPDCSPHYEFRLRLPLLPPLVWTGTRRRDPGPEWKARKRRDDGHYWEIGYSRYPLAVITSAIDKAGLRLVETYRVPEKPYHRFFKLLTDASET
jgi:hypothetical protein